MTKNLDALKGLTTPPPPAGWNAGATWDGTEGYVTTHATSEAETPSDGQWGHVFEQFGLDPGKYTIEGPVRHSAWEVPGHDVQHAYRARIVEKPDRAFDVNDLLDGIYLDSSGPIDVTAGWRTIQVGDCHIGKSVEDGAGTEMLISRWKDSVSNALSLGNYDGLHIPFMGDLIEGEASQGGKNVAHNDLTLTEQLRVARHLVSWTIQESMLAGVDLIVSTVPGNHGDHTRQRNANLDDNYDVDIVNAVEQAFSLLGHQDRIKWYYPKPGSGHIVYDVGDTGFVSLHGHTLKGQVKGAETWWAGMSASNAPAARANILMAGHYHSPVVSNFTRDKWICFGGALEDKSTWLNESNGATSQPGMLTYTTFKGKPRNFSIV